MEAVCSSRDSEIVECAKSWLGTPYQHQHSCQGVGCDCLGLIRGVYKSCVGEVSFNIPPYSPSWGELGTKEILMDAAKEFLIEVKEAKPACVLFFRMGQHVVAKHCGIMVDSNTIVHGYIRRGVVRSHLTEYWVSRIAGIFEFPERVI